MTKPPTTCAYGPAAMRTTYFPIALCAVTPKAVVDVDELGTEAAAATAVMMLTSALMDPEDPPQIVFDRPFLFLIQHLPTGLPAFVGVVNDPSA